MKRFLAVISVSALIFSFLLSGCSTGEATREQVLKEALQPAYEELESNFSGDKGEYSLVSEYLRSWAQKNSLKITKSDTHYMIITNPATSGKKKAQDMTMQCSVKTGAFKNSMETLAIGMTALMGADEHGTINLIVTEDDSGEYTGAKELPSSVCSSDNFINLEYSKDLGLYTSGAYTLRGIMSASLKRTSPKYSNAYTITMSMSDNKDPFDTDNDYPNPVNVIGNLLASQKSSGKLFQVASFKCDVSDGHIPKSATAVVVIDDNNIDSFTKKFNSSYESMKNRFDKLQDSFVYTMTETDMPSSVMTNQSSDNIISLMYTLKTGVFKQDDDTGEVIAVSDITSISTSGGRFKATIDARSLDESTLSEMSGMFSTTSGLCNINYKDSDTSMTWKSGSQPGTFFRKALSLGENEPSSVLKSSECDIFASKSKDANIISYHCNLSSTGKAALMNLIHYEEKLASDIK